MAGLPAPARPREAIADITATFERAQRQRMPELFALDDVIKRARRCVGAGNVDGARRVLQASGPVFHRLVEWLIVQVVGTDAADKDRYVAAVIELVFWVVNGSPAQSSMARAHLMPDSQRALDTIADYGEVVRTVIPGHWLELR